MPKKPPELVYGVEDEPPLLTCLLLGLQHVTIITIVLVFPVVIVRAIGGTPEQAGFFVSMSMLASGVGTILQALKKKGIGSGYLCPSVCGPSYLPASLLAAQTGGLSLLFGMTAIAGSFEVLLSRIMHRLRALFPTRWQVLLFSWSVLLSYLLPFPILWVSTPPIQSRKFPN